MAKPAFSILTVYVPGMRSVTEYVPAELVTVEEDTLVARLVTVTVAAGTTAPLVSVTVPDTPLRPCAITLAAEKITTRKQKKSRWNQRQDLMDTPKGR